MQNARLRAPTERPKEKGRTISRLSSGVERTECWQRVAVQNARLRVPTIRPKTKAPQNSTETPPYSTITPLYSCCCYISCCCIYSFVPARSPEPRRGRYEVPRAREQKKEPHRMDVPATTGYAGTQGIDDGIMWLSWVWCLLSIGFVISTPVILNGGHIYRLPSFKEGNARACVRLMSQCRAVSDTKWSERNELTTPA